MIKRERENDGDDVVPMVVMVDKAGVGGSSRVESSLSVAAGDAAADTQSGAGAGAGAGAEAEGEGDGDSPARKRGRTRKATADITTTTTTTTITANTNTNTNMAAAVAVSEPEPEAAVAGSGAVKLKLKLKAPTPASAPVDDGTNGAVPSPRPSPHPTPAPSRTASRPAAPSNAQVAQIVKSTLLDSSEAALAFLRHQGQMVPAAAYTTIAAIAPTGPGAAGQAAIAQIAEALAALALDELPPVMVTGRLSWALAMLRDPQIQGLLRRFLALRLAQLISYTVRDPMQQLGHGHGTTAQPPVLVANVVSRPQDDPVIKLLLQLCQLTFDFSDMLPRSDILLLRVQVPLLLAEIVQRKQARATEAALLAAAEKASEKTEDKILGSSKGSQASKLTITMADLRALSGSVYSKSRESVAPGATRMLAELAEPLPARTELLESVGKFVLQLLN